MADRKRTLRRNRNPCSQCSLVFCLQDDCPHFAPVWEVYRFIVDSNVSMNKEQRRMKEKTLKNFKNRYQIW